MRVEMAVQSFQELYPLTWITPLPDGSATSDIQITPSNVIRGRYDELWLTNPDAIDHHVALGINNGGTTYYCATVTVPAGAGQGSVPAVDYLVEAFGVGNIGIGWDWGTALYLNVVEFYSNPVTLTATGIGGTL